MILALAVVGKNIRSAALLEVLEEVYKKASQFNEGKVATYIPELSKMDPELFGISICAVDGSIISKGDSQKEFTMQSVSKVPAYALALDLYAEEKLMERVGVEASGEDFDSIIKLDRHKRPFNPMINAGAIAITDMIIQKFGENALEKSLDYFKKLLGRERIEIDEAVFQSELLTGERNRAIAHLLNNFALLDNPVEDVLRLYFKHCSVKVCTEDLSRLGALLANNGRIVGSNTPLIDPEHNKNILSVMSTCGMYNYAGEWFYEIGLPAKSGVSGAILSVVPGRMGVCAFSPLIDEKGSSYKAVMSHRLLSEKLGLHILS